jgi:hypothetical protein
MVITAVLLYFNAKSLGSGCCTCGIVTSFILELLIYPAISVLWKSWGGVRRLEAASP